MVAWLRGLFENAKGGAKDGPGSAGFDPMRATKVPNIDDLRSPGENFCDKVEAAAGAGGPEGARACGSLETQVASCRPSGSNKIRAASSMLFVFKATDSDKNEDMSMGGKSGGMSNGKRTDHFPRISPRAEVPQKLNLLVLHCK